MRTLTVWRAIPMLLILSGMLTGPAFLDQGHANLVLAKDNGNKNEDGNDGDHNRGHGNDPDGFDEDNPGNGNGPKTNKDKEQDDATAPLHAGADVIQAEEYLVEVMCMPGEYPGTTDCVFSGIAPEGAAAVNSITVPAEGICTEASDRQFESVAPGPGNGITGYTSSGNEASLTLTLAGKVTIAGTATYWLTAGDGVFPSTGPGLRCEATGAANGTQAPPSTPDTTGNSGELLVQSFNCADVPDDTGTFDWYGKCNQADTTHHFTLVEASTPDDQRSTETDTSGEVLFTSLPPGRYQLEIIDTSWCHAESDRVTSEGEVVIEAGQRTTVWGFICTDDGAP